MRHTKHMVNKHASRGLWRSFIHGIQVVRQHARDRYLPEYDEGHDPHVNHRYYR